MCATHTPQGLTRKSDFFPGEEDRGYYCPALQTQEARPLQGRAALVRKGKLRPALSPSLIFPTKTFLRWGSLGRLELSRKRKQGPRVDVGRKVTSRRNTGQSCLLPLPRAKLPGLAKCRACLLLTSTRAVPTPSQTPRKMPLHSELEMECPGLK
jgi:hypothetical protein